MTRDEDDFFLKFSMFAIIFLIWLWRSGPRKSINCGNKFLDISEKLCRTTFSYFCFDRGSFCLLCVVAILHSLLTFAVSPWFVCLSQSAVKTQSPISLKWSPGAPWCKKLHKLRYQVTCFFAASWNFVGHNSIAVFVQTSKSILELAEVFWGTCLRVSRVVPECYRKLWLSSCSMLLSTCFDHFVAVLPPASNNFPMKADTAMPWVSYFAR